MNNVPDSPQRERILWLSVIRQAQRDAEGRGEVDQRLQDLAKWWLTNLTRYFLAVCSRAGFSATQARYLQEQERAKYGVVGPHTRDEYFREFEQVIDIGDDE